MIEEQSENCQKRTWHEPLTRPAFLVCALARDVRSRSATATTDRGVLPFVVADVVRLMVLTRFPGLSLLLLRCETSGPATLPRIRCQRFL